MIQDLQIILILIANKVETQLAIRQISTAIQTQRRKRNNLKMQTILRD